MGQQGDAQHPVTTRLSADTWLKIILAVVAHTGTLLYAGYQYTVNLERRLTILETNQTMFMRLVDERIDGKPARAGVLVKE